MKQITAILFGLVFLGGPIFAAADIAVLEKDFAAANNYYDQALKIQKEKGEGGFMQARPYEKEFDEAKKLYLKVMDESGGRGSLYLKITETLDSHLMTGAQWQSDFQEEIVLVELTILPQILYRNAVLTYNDIALGDDLFLPPLIILPEKNYQSYRAALGDFAVPQAEASSSSATPPALNLGGNLLTKEQVYTLMSSIPAQNSFISGKLTELAEKITALESTPEKDPATLYNLGSAYLLQSYYKRLSDCLYKYQQAQAMVPQMTYTPLFKELSAFRAKVVSIKAPGEVPLYDEIDMKNMQQIKEAAAASIEYAKITLPAGMPTDREKVFPEIGNFSERVRAERSAAFDQFERLVAPIYSFNLLEVPEAAVSAFEQAAAASPSNPYYHLRLGNLYRLRALKDLTDYLTDSNLNTTGTNWMNQSEWKYVPKDEKAAVDLSKVRAQLDKAFSEYQAASKISSTVGAKGLGLFYLSLVTFNPANADLAANYFKQAGNDEAAILAGEYAKCLLARAAREESYGGFSDSMKKESIGQAAEEFNKLASGSNLRPVGASLLGEEYLTQALYKMKTSTKTKERYTDSIAMLEPAKNYDPQNPNIYLLQGFLTFRRGATLSVMDALSVIGSSFGMAFQSFTMTAGMVTDLQTMKSKNATKEEFEKYSDAKAEEYEARVKQEFGSGNDIVVRKYDPKDFLEAVRIYEQVIAQNPTLAMAPYYLGRTYSVLALYYNANSDADSAKNYSAKAKEAFKKYLELSYRE